MPRYINGQRDYAGEYARAKAAGRAGSEREKAAARAYQRALVRLKDTHPYEFEIIRADEEAREPLLETP